MQKFISEKHSSLPTDLPFSYFSTSLYLDFAAYFFERNGESLLVWQDILYPNEFPCIFMPKKKENWLRCSVALATPEDVTAAQKEDIDIVLQKPIGEEFFYATKDFVHPKGDLKNRANQFMANYNYSLSNSCAKDRVVEFYEFWKAQRQHESITFEESELFFNFCLDNLEKYNIQQIYVKANNKIIGLAWGIQSPVGNNWIGLHLKVDYHYKGLSRFLHSQRAKLFEKCPEFSLGTGVHDAGVAKYKEELGPLYKKAYYYLLTGDKKS